ncbi:MAG: EpsI family protein [Candidatus Omnitrophica bacterium]|nr:EpsI family protein [Candidatus Omnitrophota bacterium]
MKTKFDLKYVLIIILFLSVCVVSWNSYFKVYLYKDTVSIHGFPRTIGNWTSEEVELSKTEYAVLETKNAFIRHYHLPSGENVNFFVVYSQRNRKVSHPPEICYTGGGTMAISKKTQSIHIATKDDPKGIDLPFNNLVMDGLGMQQSLMYWFKVGDEFTASYWKQQMLIAFKTLMGKPSSSALIRISTVVKNNDIAGAEKTLREFAGLITPYLRTYLP